VFIFKAVKIRAAVSRSSPCNSCRSSRAAASGAFASRSNIILCKAFFVTASRLLSGGLARFLSRFRCMLCNIRGGFSRLTNIFLA
jgi:hypothetical protein